MKILHLEDSPSDAYLVQRTLSRHGLAAQIQCAKSADEFRTALTNETFDVIVVDNGLPGFDGHAALEFARQHRPDLPLIFCSGAAREDDVIAKLDLGATDYVLKEHLWQLVAALRRVVSTAPRAAGARECGETAMLCMLRVVQELSLARELHDVMATVRRAARELSGADGATFILREGDKCFYADEDAIEPLWKGQRFPMTACISGWSMLNRESAVIEDIYLDGRIPHEAYRPTFVKSLVMVPIRTADPLGAIGTYWAHQHRPTAQEVALLQMLANTTAVAVESVQLYKGLERRVQERTAELKLANAELETFSYAVSHDLRAPLRALGSDLVELHDDCGLVLTPEAVACIASAHSHARRMGRLIDDLMRLGKVSRAPVHRENVDVSALVALTLDWLPATAGAPLEKVIAPGVSADADPGLLGLVVENLLSNALKYSAHRERPRVEFGRSSEPGAAAIFFVRDNGAGFDMTHAGRLFTPFARLHAESEFPGNGIGLATVRRAVERHGGRIWAEAAPDAGATFYFTLAA
jgi:signal transduction histidine kinase/DNA-binding response OmpR family regulator